MEWFPSSLRSNTLYFRPIVLAKLRPSYGVYRLYVVFHWGGHSCLVIADGKSPDFLQLELVYDNYISSFFFFYVVYHPASSSELFPDCFSQSFSLLWPFLSPFTISRGYWPILPKGQKPLPGTLAWSICIGCNH